MRYAIDLDDTVFDFKNSFSLFCKVEYDIDFSENDLLYPGFITKKLGERKAKQLLRIFGNKDGYLNLKPIDGAIDCIKEISKNNDIYILTCRPSIYREQTEKCIKNNEFFPKEVFISEKIDKINICNALGVECIIEDNPKYCIEAQKMGINSYFMGSPVYINGKAKPFNYINSTWIRCYTWHEILKEEILTNGIKL